MAQRVFTCHEDLPAKLDMSADYCQRRGNDVCVSCICICSVCLSMYLLELSCSNSEASRTFKKSASDSSFWKGDQHHQKWRTQYTFARWHLPILPRSYGRLRHLSILNLMNPSYNRRFKFPPSPGCVTSPGLYFMHPRFAQRCLAHAALMPTLQSGGRCGGWCNGWRVWKNCWSCRRFASYLHPICRSP